MPRWHTRRVETDKGPRWIVENDRGDAQHRGYRYAGPELAERWARILNVFHDAWGLNDHDEGNNHERNSPTD